MSKETSKSVKNMANLLRQGATLTELACPACASPLFKLKSGKLWCAECKKRVVVVKEGESVENVTSKLLLSNMELTILKKIEETRKKMDKETDVEQLQKLSSTLSTLLDNLEKIRRTKRR